MKKQTGLSLVELMVAMVLGLIVVAAVIELFISSRQLYLTQDVKARMQEDGRYTVEHINRLLSRAGYRGCNSLSTQKSADSDNFDDGSNQGNRALQNLLTTNSSYFWSMDQAVSGHEATGNDTWAPAKPAGLVNATSGSDILTIRTPGAIYIPILEQKTDHFVIGENNGLVDCDPATEPNTCSNIVMVSNCDFSLVFQVTNDPSNGKLFYSSGVGIPGNSNDDVKGAFGRESWVNTIASHSFYIRNNDNGVPSLFQRTNDQQPDLDEEIIEGVEQMQIYYGVDTNDDFSVDSYVTADDVEFWSQVLSVRINLLMVNVSGASTVTNLALGSGSYYMEKNDLQSELIDPNDNRLRRVYTQTIMLKNRGS